MSEKNYKKLAIMVIGGILLLFVFCILLVGIIDGVWPWDGIQAYGRLITNSAQNSAPDKPEPTETEGSSATAGPPVVGEEVQGTTPPPLAPEGDVKEEVDLGGTGSTDGTTDGSGEEGSTSTGGKDDADASVSFGDLIGRK